MSGRNDPTEPRWSERLFTEEDDIPLDALPATLRAWARSSFENSAQRRQLLLQAARVIENLQKEEG